MKGGLKQAPPFAFLQIAIARVGMRKHYPRPFALDLPVTPGIMVNNEIVVEGGNASQEEVETCICRHLIMERPEGRVHFNNQGNLYG